MSKKIIAIKLTSCTQFSPIYHLNQGWPVYQAPVSMYANLSQSQLHHSQRQNQTLLLHAVFLHRALLLTPTGRLRLLMIPTRRYVSEYREIAWEERQIRDLLQTTPLDASYQDLPPRSTKRHCGVKRPLATNVSGHLCSTTISRFWPPREKWMDQSPPL